MPECLANPMGKERYPGQNCLLWGAGASQATEMDLGLENPACSESQDTIPGDLGYNPVPHCFARYGTASGTEDDDGCFPPQKTQIK